MGEQDRGFHADRIKVSYWDALGNETVRYFAATLSVVKLEPYKTHLAYVKERRSEDEAESLLEEALNQLRVRRGKLSPTN